MSDCGRRSSSGRQTRERLSFDMTRSAALSSTLHHASSTSASKVKRPWCRPSRVATTWSGARTTSETRSEEHTSELQSRGHLVCRLLLEKKKKKLKTIASAETTTEHI